MARDYTRAEVLDIIESEARDRNIPRDDFLRFAYIETGGRFDEQVSRGPNSAKGLFQFVPSTARAYGIQGNELDAVANTDAAARLYLDNRRALINASGITGRPYLSNKPEPDGLDMYMAHQQGAAGYRSIQAAIATGEFSRADTRANILNNVSSRDFEAVTGRSYNELARMSDRDMASVFVGYWDAKFDRIRIPEKNIEPIAATAPAQPKQSALQTSGGIELNQAHALSVRYDDVTYGFGIKDVETGRIDCSGWVVHLQNATMNEINQEAGRQIFARQDKFSPGMDSAAAIVEKSVRRSGVLLEGNQVARDALREGMVIGEDNGDKSWDRGRYKGIDHVVMVVREPASGDLMISQSRGREGVELISIDNYLKRKNDSGAHLYATDPLAQARALLQDKQPSQAQAREKQTAAQAEAMSDGMLKLGEKGDEVRALQVALNRLGYRDGGGQELRSDGDFGPRTKDALLAFQRDQGLKEDGIAGARTLDVLARTERKPLISEAGHPGNGLFRQALDKMDPAAFRSRQEMERAAGAVAFEAKVSGLSRIDHVVAGADGKGLFAVQGRLDDPGHQRVYADKAQASQQSLQQSSQLWQQDEQHQQMQSQAQQRDSVRMSM